jgi:glycosyltransferase involved in cell wall biosynthesis
MRVGFCTPSLHIAGGGERYLLAIIQEAVKLESVEVVVMSPKVPRPQDWDRLGVAVPPSAFVWRRTRDNLLIRGTGGLDLFVAMRGTRVPPVSHAKRSVAIIQFPQRDLVAPIRLDRPGSAARAVKTLIERRAVASYDRLVCYSEFAKHYVAKNFGRPDAVVIYPPVDAASRTGPKEPIILGVGRFIAMKRQDVLINAFRELRSSLPADSPWELHLVGGIVTDETSEAYMVDLRRLAQDLPVTFHPNLSLADLRTLYQRASIFWHAAGFGSQDGPELQEHFGITTVEAMNHGCVPVVIGLGGQPEIVADQSDGLLWMTPQELVVHTRELIVSPSRRFQLAQAATQGGERFATDQFRKRVREIILTP